MKTLKYLIVFMLMVFLTIPLSTEGRDRRSFSALILGGSGSAWISSSDSNVVSEGVLGGAIGLGINVGLSDLFSLQLEALYATKGGKYNYDYQFEFGNIRSETYYEYDLLLTYIEMPLLLKFSFRTSYGTWPYSNDSPLLFDFFAGPYVGINLLSFPHSFYMRSEAFRKNSDGKWETIEFSRQETRVVPSDIEDIFDTGINQLDVGFIGGLGLEIELSRVTSFFLQGRMQAGFLNVDNGQFALITKMEPPRNIPSRNMALLAMGGWRFKLWQQ